MTLGSGSVLLFDVDGVLTDEHARVDFSVVGLILEAVQRGSEVAFITGRSRSWLEANLVSAIVALGGEPYSAAFRFAAEMGALRLGQSTGFVWGQSEEHSVPRALREALIPLPTQRKLDDLIEWDATKEATATFESLHRPGVPGHAARAREALAGLLPECEALAHNHGCRAALSTYALDVLAPSLSKRVGAEFAIGDIGDSSRHSAVFVFGDSPGDLVMAERARGMTSGEVEFVWVGRGAAPLTTEFLVVSSALPHAPGTGTVLRELLTAE